MRSGQRIGCYDDTGWTLGLMQHAEVHAIDDKTVLDVPLEPIGAARDIGRVAGTEASFGHAVAHYGSTNMVTLRYRLGDLMVEAAEAAFEAEGIEFPPGSLGHSATCAAKRRRADRGGDRGARADCRCAGRQTRHTHP